MILVWGMEKQDKTLSIEDNCKIARKLALLSNQSTLIFNITFLTLKMNLRQKQKYPKLV